MTAIKRAENPKQNRYEKLKDAVWLHRQYVKRHRSMADIAQEVGCYENSVRNAIRKSGISIRRYTVSPAALEARKRGGSAHRRTTKGERQS